MNDAYAEAEATAVRRVQALRAKGWPYKDIATKLTEEGVAPICCRPVWNVAAVKEALQMARGLLTRTEMAEWLTRVGAAAEVLDDAIRALPPEERDAAAQAFHITGTLVQRWAVEQATRLDDGEALRRLRPGWPGLLIQPSREAGQAAVERARNDRDSHAAWVERRKAATSSRDKN